MRAVRPTPSEAGLPSNVAAAALAVQTALTPAERLVFSRECLRQALRDASAPPGQATDQRTGGSSVTWLASLNSIPGAAVVIAAVNSWWAQHPLRTAGLLAADAVKAVVQPIAQRNPLGLVLGAFLLGGLLAWARPWRRLLTPALIVGLLPQLLFKAIAYVPPGSWSALLAALAQQQRRSKEAAQRTGSTFRPAQAPANSSKHA